MVLLNLGKCTSASVKLLWTTRNFIFSLQPQLLTQFTTARQVHAFQVWFFFSWWFVGEVQHSVHLIHWNLHGRLWPRGMTWQRSRLGLTHDILGLNWVPFINYFAVSLLLPTNPHSVPSSSPVPLCNVLWGLGVCPVLVRSVSLRRLVLEGSFVPLPPALFWPFARRLRPLFSSSCLSGLSRLRPGVCVCNN